MTLLDSTPTTFEDLSSNCFLSEADIGFGRASVCRPRLEELNPYVKVTVAEGGLSESLLLQFTVVVLIEVPVDQLVPIAALCHNQGIAVIVADVYGVFGSVFCDFGERFVVSDVDGENAATSMVAHISNENPAVVTVLEESRHRLQTGDRIHLSELVGPMDVLNGREFTVNVKDPYSFEIDFDGSSLGGYVRGGFITEVKAPKVFHFAPYEESWRNPGEIIGDFSKLDRLGPLHLGFRSLQQFRNSHGRLPHPGSATDAETVYRTALSLNSSLSFKAENLPEHEGLLRRLAMCARGIVSPVCGVIGGIVGQEVIKACSAKFTPIRQWFYFDGSEALPSDPLPEEDVRPLGCRYDSQIMVFGRELQRSMQQLSMFLVGAGAIGCEMLKTWSLMGVSCGDSERGILGGTTHVTDMDQIELSNLSRQFLFRSTDINKPKSSTAARAVQAINSNMRMKAYELKVAPDTENIFNDDFYDSIDMICTALDNMEARLYVDQRCLFYQKPMLESGTQGTKGNTQVVVPNVTENYGATRDPPVSARSFY